MCSDSPIPTGLCVIITVVEHILVVMYNLIGQFVMVLQTPANAR